MRDKDWLCEFVDQRPPRSGFAVGILFDLIGIAAVCCFAVALAYMLGAI